MKATLSSLAIAAGLFLFAGGCKKELAQSTTAPKTGEGHKARPGSAEHAGHGDRTEHKKLTVATKPPVAFDSPPKVGTTARCPVMGNVFTVSVDTQRSQYKGKHVAFCCPGCKPKFDADPEKYLNKPGG